MTHRYLSYFRPRVPHPRVPHPGALLVLLLLLLALPGCNGGPSTDDADPSWADELPQAAASAAPGTRGWLAVPRGDGVRWTLGIADGEGAWRDPLGRLLVVPAALSHELPDGEDAAEGPYAVLLDGETIAVGVAGGEPDVYRIDWNGRTQEVRADAAWPLAQGSPWRLYSDETGRRLRGVEIAVHGDFVWLVSDAGTVEKVDAAQVEPQALGLQRQPGDSVTVFDWAHGGRPGTVKGVDSEDDLRLVIELEDGSESAFFFADLVSNSL